MRKSAEIIPAQVSVICVGNICRSPVGEALLRTYAEQSSNPTIHHIQFDSAGLFGGRLNIADHSVEFLQKRGISTNDFKSKKTTRAFFDQSDLIIVMEQYMKDFILIHYYSNLSSGIQKKIRKRILTLHEAAGEKGEVPDPYHTSAEKFLRVLQTIDVACQKIVKRWENFPEPHNKWRQLREKFSFFTSKRK